MIKDSVTLGVLAGFAGNIVKEIIAWTFHFFGYLRYTFDHIAAGLFVPAQFLDNPVSLISGVITDWTVAGTLGVLMLVFLRRTGHDYWLLKSIGFASILYVFMYGALMALNVTRASLLTPLPNFILWIPHTAFGIVTGYALIKFDSEENATS